MPRICLLHRQFPGCCIIANCISKHDLKSVYCIALITKPYMICHFSTAIYIQFMAMETYIYRYGELFGSDNLPLQICFLTESLKDAVVMLLKGNFAQYVCKDVFLMAVVMEVTTCFCIFLQLELRPYLL